MHPFQWQFKVDMARTPAHYHLYVLAHVVLMAPVILPAAAHSLSLFRLTTSNITYFQLSQDGRHNGKNLPFFCSPIMLVSFGVTNMRSRNKATCWGDQHVLTRVLTLLGWPDWLVVFLTGCGDTLLVESCGASAAIILRACTAPWLLYSWGVRLTCEGMCVKEEGSTFRTTMQVYVAMRLGNIWATAI